MAMQGYATVSYRQITSYNKLFTQLHNGSQVEHILSNLHLTSTILHL